MNFKLFLLISVTLFANAKQSNVGHSLLSRKVRQLQSNDTNQTNATAEPQANSLTNQYNSSDSNNGTDITTENLTDDSLNNTWIGECLITDNDCLDAQISRDQNRKTAILIGVLVGFFGLVILIGITLWICVCCGCIACAGSTAAVTGGTAAAVGGTAAAVGGTGIAAYCAGVYACACCASTANLALHCCLCNCLRVLCCSSSKKTNKDKNSIKVVDHKEDEEERDHAGELALLLLMNQDQFKKGGDKDVAEDREFLIRGLMDEYYQENEALNFYANEKRKEKELKIKQEREKLETDLEKHLSSMQHVEQQDGKKIIEEYQKAQLLIDQQIKKQEEEEDAELLRDIQARKDKIKNKQKFAILKDLQSGWLTEMTSLEDEHEKKKQELKAKQDKFKEQQQKLQMDRLMNLGDDSDFQKILEQHKVQQKEIEAHLKKQIDDENAELDGILAERKKKILAKKEAEAKMAAEAKAKAEFEKAAAEAKAKKDAEAIKTVEAAKTYANQTMDHHPTIMDQSQQKLSAGFN